MKAKIIIVDGALFVLGTTDQNVQNRICTVKTMLSCNGIECDETIEILPFKTAVVKYGGRVHPLFGEIITVLNDESILGINGLMQHLVGKGLLWT